MRSGKLFVVRRGFDSAPAGSDELLVVTTDFDCAPAGGYRPQPEAAARRGGVAVRPCSKQPAATQYKSIKTDVTASTAAVHRPWDWRLLFFSLLRLHAPVPSNKKIKTSYTEAA